MQLKAVKKYGREYEEDFRDNNILKELKNSMYYKRKSFKSRNEHFEEICKS